MKGEKLKKQLEECLENWKRERAAFLNYKKEEAERVGEFVKFANQELILKILPILDNIYIAEKKLPRELKGNLWVQGFLKTKTQILDFLKKERVEEIKCLGEKFDPSFQEAVGEIKKPGSEPGIVIEEIKKGYTLHGRVLRPAKVKIAK
ncbi:nucleotide exchange factor GrpE [Patescibacteria group bacterium]|nr:nucleotide exchange factor GrpE [Patescibacteria group bacterium]